MFSLRRPYRAAAGGSNRSEEEMTAKRSAVSAPSALPGISPTGGEMAGRTGFPKQ